MRTRLRKLDDDGLPTLFSVYPEGLGVDPPGLFGGVAGRGVRGVVLNLAGEVVHDCGTGELITLSTTDRIVEVQLAGGTGFGDPRARDRRLVAGDVADQYLSAPEAQSQYGGVAEAAD